MDFPLSLEEFNYIYSKVPRLNVEIIVKTDKGVVLTKRNIEPWKGFWHLPGGAVLMGETLEKAVERVALREIGVRVKVDKTIGSIVYPSIKEQNNPGWPVGIAYLTHIESGELRSSDQDDEVATFTEIPENTIPEQYEFILNLQKDGTL